MESLLILLGMLVATFLVISAAAEAILEVIRGFMDFLSRNLNMLLYRFFPEKTKLINISSKIAWPKSKVSLDQAIQMARDFDPDMNPMESKFQALEATVGQIGTLSTKYEKELISLRDQVLTSTSPVEAEDNPVSKPQALFGSGPENKDPGKYDNWSKLTIAVKNDIDQYNRERIFFARLLAGIIGCFLVWQLDFSIFDFITDAMNSEGSGTKLTEFQSKFLNIIVGGFAASVGSSYWHDQLKKVRNLKNASKAALASASK